MARAKSSPKKRKSTAGAIFNMRIGNRQYKIRTSLMKTIMKLQHSIQPCIPRLSFQRLVREIIQEQSFNPGMRIQYNALVALQESAEFYLVGLFADCNLLALHARRITVRNTDIKLCLTLKKEGL